MLCAACWRAVAAERGHGTHTLSAQCARRCCRATQTTVIANLEFSANSMTYRHGFLAAGGLHGEVRARVCVCVCWGRAGCDEAAAAPSWCDTAACRQTPPPPVVRAAWPLAACSWRCATCTGGRADATSCSAGWWARPSTTRCTWAGPAAVRARTGGAR
jgi:hypothetical protein